MKHQIFITVQNNVIIIILFLCMHYIEKLVMYVLVKCKLKASTIYLKIIIRVTKIPAPTTTGIERAPPNMLG